MVLTSKRTSGKTAVPRILICCFVVTLLRANSYVGPQLCFGCHSKIAETYARTGMARSFHRPQEQPETKFFHQPSATWYAMEKRDGGYYQKRWRIGPAGQEIDVQESRIDYVMGSGNHAKTYLHRTDRGALVELPLGWYSEAGGTWAMSPGHDRPYALPPRTIAYECMFCHNAYPQIPPGHGEAGSEALYEAALPEGVDCQRCHGPGGDHVRAAQTRGSTPAAIRGAIVNPARLSPERQMEVCMQCHLETTSEPIPHSIVRYGRAPFSYRPGEPLGAFEIFFDRAPGAKHPEGIEIAHSAYRLRQSRCFLESKGSLTCTTCHNPHDIPRGEAAAKHYNAVCGGCHSTKPASHTAAANCVDCHMPKRRTLDVVHVVMTDHRIVRLPPAGDLLAPLAEKAGVDANQYRGEVAQYYPAAADSLYLAVAQVTQRSNLARGLPQLAAEVARQRPARAEFYLELGQAWLAAGDRAKALDSFEQAVAREPGSPVARLNLADVLTQAGQNRRAAEVLQRALKTAPEDPLLWYQLGIAQSDAAALEKTIALDPDFAEAHNLLGETLAGSGDLDRAGQEFRKALEVNPDLPEALGNLGHLLAARGALAEAAFYFARSVEVRPNDAGVRTNYAVTLAGLNQFDAAQRQIDAAVKADPKSADAHNFRGTLLVRGGNGDEALREFLEAVRLHPDFALAHLNAGRILAAKGDRAGAEKHLRLALQEDDSNVGRQAAAELLRLGFR